MFFRVNNFLNTKAMRLNFFSKCSNFHLSTKNEIKNTENFLKFKIDAFELVAANSAYYAKKTWRRHSMG